MYQKKEIIDVSDMELEVYISSKLPETLNEVDLSSLVIFLGIYFSERRVYRIISSIVQVDYEYLYGSLYPKCSYEEFYPIAKALEPIEVLFDLERSESLLPQEEDNLFLQIGDQAHEVMKLVSFLVDKGIPRTIPVMIGGVVFYKIVDIFSLHGIDVQKGIKLLFVWHDNIIRYFIDGR